MAQVVQLDQTTVLTRHGFVPKGQQDARHQYVSNLNHFKHKENKEQDGTSPVHKKTSTVSTVHTAKSTSALVGLGWLG